MVQTDRVREPRVRSFLVVPLTGTHRFFQESQSLEIRSFHGAGGFDFDADEIAARILEHEVDFMAYV